MTEQKYGFLQSFLGYSTLAIVLISSLMLGANRPASWLFMSIVVLVLFTIQIAHNFSRPAPPQAAKIMLPALLFLVPILWGTLQGLPGLPAALAHPFWDTVPEAAGHISVDPGRSIHIVMRYLTYGMIFWIILRSAANPEIAARMLRTIAIFSTVLALYGIYAFVTGENPILENLTAGGVLQATFVNRNNYATYAAFGVLANIAAYLHVTKGPRSGLDGWLARLRDGLENFYGGAWIYAFGAIICIGAVSLTQSRAGALAGLIGLFVFIRLWQGRKEGNDWIMTGAIVAVLVFVAFTSATGLAQRFLAADGEEGRFIVYPAIIGGIFDRPLLGHGLGAFHDGFRPYLPVEAAVGEWLRAHNSYLENLFELGIPAALALYASLALIGLRIWQGARNRRRMRIFPVFAMGCFAIGAFHSILDFSLQMPAAAALFAAIMAIGYAQSFLKEEIETPRPVARDRRRQPVKDHSMTMPRKPV